VKDLFCRKLNHMQVLIPSGIWRFAHNEWGRVTGGRKRRKWIHGNGLLSKKRWPEEHTFCIVPQKCRIAIQIGKPRILRLGIVLW
jgi:hypothetical protein